MASEHLQIEISAGLVGFQMCSRGSCWSSNIGGYDWTCDYTTTSSSGTVSLILSFSSGNTGAREPLNARFKFSLLDRELQPVPCGTRACSFQNWSPHHGWEWLCDDFITREDLDRQEYRLDDGGCFTVRCDIAVKPFTAKATDASVTVPPSDLHQHLGNLLVSKDGADVTFTVASGGSTFHAHRCVLAARSPVFRAQLFGEMKESKETATGGVVIAIDDMDAYVFTSLLRFVYTDLLPDIDRYGDGYLALAHYMDLLVAADRYGLERMKLLCQERLCRSIRAHSVESMLWRRMRVHSVARMLAFADRHHCPGLKEACFDFLSSSTNLKLFTETDEFEELTDSCPGVLKELLAKLATVLIFE